MVLQSTKVGSGRLLYGLTKALPSSFFFDSNSYNKKNDMALVYCKLVYYISITASRLFCWLQDLIIGSTNEIILWLGYITSIFIVENNCFQFLLSHSLPEIIINPIFIRTIYTDDGSRKENFVFYVLGHLPLFHKVLLFFTFYEFESDAFYSRHYLCYCDKINVSNKLIRRKKHYNFL